MSVKGSLAQIVVEMIIIETSWMQLVTSVIIDSESLPFCPPYSQGHFWCIDLFCLTQDTQLGPEKPTGHKNKLGHSNLTSKLFGIHSTRTGRYLGKT